MSALNKGTIMSQFLFVIDLISNPEMDLPFLQTRLMCCSKLSKGSTLTPRSFSQSVVSSSLLSFPSIQSSGAFSID